MRRKGAYLLVELHEGGFEVGADVGSEVVGESSLGETLALFILGLSEVGSRVLREVVERHNCVLAVSDDLLLDVGDSLVVDQRGVVSGHEAGEFREVGCHYS